MFGLQYPLTCKPSTTLSNLTNKVRGKYICKEVFLCLPSCVFVLASVLLLCRYDAVDDYITNLFISLSIYPSLYLFIILSISFCISLFTYLFIPKSIYLSISLFTYLFIHQFISLAISLSLYQSIHLFIYQTLYLSLYPSIHLFIYQSLNLSISTSITANYLSSAIEKVDLD